MIRGTKTIAEFAIRNWMDKKGLISECFQFEMIGPREAEIRDLNGDKLRLVYDPDTRLVLQAGD